ncbi:MAG: tyrosine-type recombinase/integrase [Jatrophihabitantaceae bacterium]
MASIEKRQRTSGGRITWRASYRTPEGRQRSKSFDRKVDAARFLTTVESAKLGGSYVDPARSVGNVGDLARTWLAGKVNLKPSTAERYAGIVREHIEPRWGKVRLADVTHGAVQTWVGKLTGARSAATVRKAHGVLSLILASAVRDGRVARNPCEGISLPRIATAEHIYLTHEQVDDLADACGEHRLAVLFLAYTGIRFGELAALRVGHLDLMRRRATIAESVTEVGGRGLVWGTPKGHERRDVPIHRFLIDELAAHVAGKPADALVFTAPQGGTLRVRNFRRVALDPAAKALGVEGLHPHALRHTAASLAIASGADVKVVQQMLGHKSATMTLDLYGHLFGDRLDVVSDAMDAARTAALAVRVAHPLPTAAVIELDAARQVATAQ